MDRVERIFGCLVEMNVVGQRGIAKPIIYLHF